MVEVVELDVGGVDVVEVVGAVAVVELTSVAVEVVVDDLALVVEDDVLEAPPQFARVTTKTSADDFFTRR